MAEKYISFTDLMKTARGNRALRDNLGNIIDFQQIIDDAPTADVEEVKRGEWLWDTEDKYKCSCCHYETRVDEVMGLPRYKYCPFCGAKMNC